MLSLTMATAIRKRAAAAKEKAVAAKASRRKREKENEGDLAVSKLFETSAARATAVSLLLFSQLGLFVLCCQTNSVSSSSATLVWSFVLIFQHGWVLAPGTDPARARKLTYICSFFIATLPHLPVCKEGLGRATGAAQGAASMLTIMRAFQTLHRIEEGHGSWKKANGRWRRFFQGCGLSWHDLDQGRARALAQHERAQHAWNLFYRLMIYISLLAAPAAVISHLPVPKAILSAQMLLRCLLMAGALVASFNVFDTAYLCLMSVVNGIAVKSIMKGGFWSAKTVSEIWLGWNLPVQRLLSRGVYLPLRKRGIPRTAARFAVFLISGAGHVYPCVVCGLKYTEIAFMMSFFVAQVLLIALENALGLRSGFWAIGIEILLSPLFVCPVMMFTDPSLVSLQHQLGFFTI